VPQSKYRSTAGLLHGGPLQRTGTDYRINLVYFTSHYITTLHYIACNEYSVTSEYMTLVTFTFAGKHHKTL